MNKELKIFYATLSTTQNIYEKYGPGCVEIFAKNELEARKLIREATNNRWAFMYSSLNDIHHPMDRKILATLGETKQMEEI